MTWPEEKRRTIHLRKALEQFRFGPSLFGKRGAFAPMLNSFLESALEGESDSYLDEEVRNDGNRKHGKTGRQFRLLTGLVQLETRRDRNATFELN